MYGLPRGLSQTAVPRKDVVEPFFEQHPQRFSKTEEQKGGGGVRKESLLHVAYHRTPVVEISRRSVLLRRLKRSRSHAEDGAAWRQHEALLRAGQRDIYPPFSHSEIDRPKRTDDIDKEQRIASGAVDATPHRANIRRDSCGGLVVDDQDGTVLGLEVGFNVGLGDRVTPSQLDVVHLHAQLSRGFGVQPREMAVLEAQYPIAGAQGVDEGCLPGSCSAAREDHGLALF